VGVTRGWQGRSGRDVLENKIPDFNTDAAVAANLPMLSPVSGMPTGRGCESGGRFECGNAGIGSGGSKPGRCHAGSNCGTFECGNAGIRSRCFEEGKSDSSDDGRCDAGSDDGMPVCRNAGVGSCWSDVDGHVDGVLQAGGETGLLARERCLLNCRLSVDGWDVLAKKG
jgi:hypothetical protein